MLCLKDPEVQVQCTHLVVVVCLHTFVVDTELLSEQVPGEIVVGELFVPFY